MRGARAPHVEQLHDAHLRQVRPARLREQVGAARGDDVIRDPLVLLVDHGALRLVRRLYSVLERQVVQPRALLLNPQNVLRRARAASGPALGSRTLRPWPVAGSRCLHEPPRTRCCMQAHGSTTSDACICGNTKACCEAPHGLSAEFAAARYAIHLCACQRIPKPTDQPARSQHGSCKSAVYTVADGDTLTAALQGWACLLCEPLVRPRGRPLLLCLRSLRPQQSLNACSCSSAGTAHLGGSCQKSLATAASLTAHHSCRRLAGICQPTQLVTEIQSSSLRAAANSRLTVSSRAEHRRRASPWAAHLLRRSPAAAANAKQCVRAAQAHARLRAQRPPHGLPQLYVRPQPADWQAAVLPAERTRAMPPGTRLLQRPNSLGEPQGLRTGEFEQETADCRIFTPLAGHVASVPWLYSSKHCLREHARA